LTRRIRDMNESPDSDPFMPEVDSPPAAENPAGGRKVREVSLWRYWWLWPLAWLVRIWCATLRFRVSDEEREMARSCAAPVVTVIWHNRLFIGREIGRRFRPGRPMVALVSASRDGAWLTAFFRLTGWDTVRGSSSWRGMQATRELLRRMEAGADLGITPDGPRGPCYDMKSGVLLLARLSRAPILLYSARFHSAWRMRSWDGFYVPKPFSVVEIRIRLLPGYAVLGGEDSESATRELRRRLMEITLDE
jgi:hypothetical protein